MLTPSLWAMIRARRLGWGWCTHHGAFIRISGDERLFVELCPVDNIPAFRHPEGIREHRAWWDCPDDILGHLRWLKGVTVIKAYVAVEIDDDGRIIREYTGPNAVRG